MLPSTFCGEQKTGISKQVSSSPTTQLFGLSCPNPFCGKQKVQSNPLNFILGIDLARCWETLIIYNTPKGTLVQGWDWD